jgi:hypothetical protein
MPPHIKAALVRKAVVAVVCSLLFWTDVLAAPRLSLSLSATLSVLENEKESCPAQRQGRRRMCPSRVESGVFLVDEYIGY